MNDPQLEAQKQAAAQQWTADESPATRSMTWRRVQVGQKRAGFLSHDICYERSIAPSDFVGSRLFDSDRRVMHGPSRGKTRLCVMWWSCGRL